MRATLSLEKKYELAFSALSSEFVGEQGRLFTVLTFRPKNDLGLAGFYQKPYFTSVEDMKNAKTREGMIELLEMNLLNPETVNKLTNTSKGAEYIKDYSKAKAIANNTFEGMFNAYKDQVVSMYTLKAQKDMFEAFTKNITQLYNANILDKNFVNSAVAQMFPQSKWEVSPKLDEVKEVKVINTSTNELNI